MPRSHMQSSHSAGAAALPWEVRVPMWIRWDDCPTAIPGAVVQWPRGAGGSDAVVQWYSTSDSTAPIDHTATKRTRQVTHRAEARGPCCTRREWPWRRGSTLIQYESATKPHDATGRDAPRRSVRSSVRYSTSTPGNWWLVSLVDLCWVDGMRGPNGIRRRRRRFETHPTRDIPPWTLRPARPGLC
jgi:hypothetical protein